MSLFTKKRQKDDADLLFEQAKQRAYGREVKKIAVSKGWKTGKQLAQQRFNQPQTTGLRAMDFLNKNRNRLEAIANADWIGAKPENMPELRKKSTGQI